MRRAGREEPTTRIVLAPADDDVLDLERGSGDVFDGHLDEVLVAHDE